MAVGDELYGGGGINALAALAYDTPLSTGDGVYITDGEVDDIGVVGCHIALPLLPPIDVIFIGVCYLLRLSEYSTSIY